MAWGVVASEAGNSSQIPVQISFKLNSPSDQPERPSGTV